MTGGATIGVQGEEQGRRDQKERKTLIILSAVGVLYMAFVYKLLELGAIMFILRVGSNMWILFR